MNGAGSVSALICQLLFILFLFTSCSNRAEKLPDYGQVPAFTMTDSDGRSFQSSALAGKVWIADFIYTTCPAACPMMSSKMSGIHKQLAGQPDVRIVSFSVDPLHDTPSALKQFGSHYGGATNDWIFLTGTPDTVHLLAYTTFHVGDVLGKIEHSTKFILVDKRGHIRGYYSSIDPEGIPALLDDLDALRKD
jgi:protein SCO1/2